MKEPYWHTDPYWDADPEFLIGDWKYEVDNNDTRLGYHDWVKAKRTAA